MIDYLYLDSNYYRAWLAMSMVLRGLKPEHKVKNDYKDLYRGLQYSIRRVDSVRWLNAPDAQIRRLALAFQIDKDFHSRFMSLLWANKMLSEGAYSFFDTSKNKDSDTVKLERGDRDLTGIK